MSMKRPFEEDSEDESDTEEWVEIGAKSSDMPEISVRIPNEVASEHSLISIKDKTLRHQTILTLFSCIIVNLLKLKPKFLLNAPSSKVIFKFDFRRLDFKVFYKLSKPEIYVSFCVCSVEKLYCSFCKMTKNVDYKRDGLIGKVIKTVSNDCFLLEANHDFGIIDITNTLPFNPSRAKYAQYFSLIGWLYSTGQRVKRAPLKMPTSVKGFKDHPFFCLKKTLNANQCLDVQIGEERKLSIGVFKNEAVYPTSLIRQLYSERELLRMGKSVLMGEDPVKLSGNRKLYGEWQCEALKRPELVDGKIPTNQYGSIELVHKNMLPLGCQILNQEYLNVCKFLDAEYVPILVGFNRKIPIYSGIVVKSESVSILYEVYSEFKRQENEIKQQHNQLAVLQRWAKLVMGYLLKKRLEADYL